MNCSPSDWATSPSQKGTSVMHHSDHHSPPLCSGIHPSYTVWKQHFPQSSGPRSRVKRRRGRGVRRTRVPAATAGLRVTIDSHHHFSPSRPFHFGSPSATTSAALDALPGGVTQPGIPEEFVPPVTVTFSGWTCCLHALTVNMVPVPRVSNWITWVLNVFLLVPSHGTTQGDSVQKKTSETQEANTIS